MSDVAARPWRILSLCSGIGGLDLGVATALGGRAIVAAYVEREAYPAAVLCQRAQEGRLPDAPVWSDIATFDPGPWRGCVDAVIGSYPCVSLSNAGRRRGTADPRWLWPHFARIVAVVRPAWCFFENVAQHARVGLDVVYRDLRGLGYRLAAGLFEAAEVGASHLRRRLFLYASLLADADGKGGLQQSRLVGAVGGRAEHGGGAGDGGGQTWRQRWSSSADVRRISYGTRDRMDRLRALGNAVVPQCAAYALRTLAGAMTGETE